MITNEDSTDSITNLLGSHIMNVGQPNFSIVNQQEVATLMQSPPIFFNQDESIFPTLSSTTNEKNEMETLVPVGIIQPFSSAAAQFIGTTKQSNHKSRHRYHVRRSQRLFNKEQVHQSFHQLPSLRRK